MPIRIVINNHTISILEGVDFSNTYYISNVASSNLIVNSERPNCLLLYTSDLQSNKNITICPFNTLLTLNSWKDEWISSFTEFKTKCPTVKYIVDTEDITPEEESEIEEKLGRIKVNLIKKKQEEIALSLEEEEVHKQLDEVDKSEIDQIEKEFVLEKLIQTESKEKELFEINKIKEEISKEQEKMDCLSKNIQQKEIENENIIDKITQIDDVKDRKTILKKRSVELMNEYSIKIQNMKLENNLSREKLKSQLKKIRYQIAEEAKNANKNSNYVCSYIYNSEDYCKAKLGINPVLFSKCVLYSNNLNYKTEWCDLCCNNEHGVMFQNDRIKCFRGCNSGDVNSKQYVINSIKNTNQSIQDNQSNLNKSLSHETNQQNYDKQSILNHSQEEFKNISNSNHHSSESYQNSFHNNSEYSSSTSHNSEKTISQLSKTDSNNEKTNWFLGVKLK